MSQKSVQLSVRISDDDAAFLARTAIDGAATPSDKMRAIIGEARRYREERDDYAGCLRLLREMVGPAQDGWREAERAAGQRSELPLALLEWLTEALAFVMTHVPEPEAGGKLRSALEAFEGGLADRV